MIQAVYIISRDGIPLFFVDFTSAEDKTKEVTLFSGIISAIQVAMAEIDVGVPSFFDTEKSEIFMSVTEKFALAIVKDNISKVDREIMQKLIDKILTGLTFKNDIMLDFNMMGDEEKDEIEQTIVNAVESWTEELNERDATKRISDSLW